MGDKKQSISRFEEVFKNMWVNNGNEVSRIYAGTGAIQGGSKLMDGTRSVARTIQNNLLDNTKQEAIDILLLGSTLSSELADRARILLPQNMLHAPTTILREMCKRYNEYVQPKNLRIQVGTYNVNGGKHFRSVALKDSLCDWLLDWQNISSEKSLVDLTNVKDVSLPADIYAIGFQEIVDLNASNIVAASTDNAKLWAEELQKTISRDNEYALLTYHQLVGVCLYVFIRSVHIPYIRDVAIDCVKTGLGGATGNKGACAIRLVLHGTSICFVCAHFAAGQSQVNERNADYNEITRKISFPMGRSLKSHDYVFWCGDFNYRIDMDKEELKESIKNKDLTLVLQNDQLRKEQLAGNVFTDFLEGEITFDPTYKYDVFSDDYDTSEKQRAPAWTDRVLWRRRKALAETADVNASNWNPGTLIHYGRSELKQSDHRPVIAIIDIEVSHLNVEQRQLVFKNVIQSLGPPDATIIISAADSSSNDDSIHLYDENVTSSVIQELSQFGEVTLVRYVEDQMWISFRDGQSALNAVKNERNTINGLELIFKLKTENWLEQVEREINLCTLNVLPLCEYKNTNEVIPVEKPKMRPPPMRPPMPKSPRNSPVHKASNDQNTKSPDSSASAGVYEEISDDYQPQQPHHPPPPPPIVQQRPVPPVPTNAVPPPLPKRPPPIPSRNTSRPAEN